MIHKDAPKRVRSAAQTVLSLKHEASISPKGTFFIDVWDQGELVLSQRLDNIITRDGGILAARLFRDSQDPNAGRSNGVTMLAVGTGATGSLLSPDAPQATQRRLNSEIARKAFASTTYRNNEGVAVAYATNIVDFTTVFGESEGVGPWTEMGLMCTASLNPMIKSPIDNGPTNYDATIDVADHDILVNYLTFPVISKSATMVISVTWRLTF